MAPVLNDVVAVETGSGTVEPLGAMLLGDYGVRVGKLERPDGRLAAPRPPVTGVGPQQGALRSIFDRWRSIDAREVLLELGFDGDEVEDLRAPGVVGW